MANDLYRGYEIKPHANGGFYWTDERGFDHTGNDVLNGVRHVDSYTDCHTTSGAAMDDIDRYRRNLRAA